MQNHGTNTKDHNFLKENSDIIHGDTDNYTTISKYYYYYYIIIVILQYYDHNDSRPNMLVNDGNKSEYYICNSYEILINLRHSINNLSDTYDRDENENVGICKNNNKSNKHFR